MLTKTVMYFLRVFNFLWYILGAVRSMRHFKSEVDSVKLDVECGLILSDASVSPVQGDLVVCYEYKEEDRDVEWDLQF